MPAIVFKFSRQNTVFHEFFAGVVKKCAHTFIYKIYFYNTTGEKYEKNHIVYYKHESFF